MTTEQAALPSLEDILQPLVGHQRKFMLYRIADLPVEQARVLCGVKTAEYNHWFDGENEDFRRINARRTELIQTYRKEAIRLLRKDNQIAAILMEGKMIDVMSKELDSRNYDLLKTPIAKDVYSKLVTDLDVTAPPVNPWQARLQALIINNNPPLPAPPEVRVLEVANVRNLQANPSTETECAEGELLTESEQGFIPSETEVCPAETT